jgi:hypothetical protein
VESHPQADKLNATSLYSGRTTSSPIQIQPPHVLSDPL